MSKYPEVPHNHKGETTLEYSWFVVNGYGFALHWRTIAIDLICVYQNAMDMIFILMGYEKKKPIVEILELVLQLNTMKELSE